MTEKSMPSLPTMTISRPREESDVTTLAPPAALQGGLFKKRKLPSKGWIKRYFSLQDGILKYAVNYSHSAKLKYHGIYDLGRSTIVFYSQAKRFDIDSDNGVCHIKCKNSKEYEEWSLALRKHRMYKLGSVWGREDFMDENHKKALRARSSSMQNHALANWIVNTDYFVQDFKTTLDEAKSQLNQIMKSNSIMSLPTDSTASTPLANESKNTYPRSSKKSSAKNKNRRSVSPSRTLPVITNLDAVIIDKGGYRNSVPTDFDSKAPFDVTSLTSSLTCSDTILHAGNDTTPAVDSVCSKLSELIHMLERQQQELKIALQQESEKYTQQRVVITNLKLSLNEALTQNTEYREKLNKIKGIVNSDSDTQFVEEQPENDSNTLPMIEEIQEWSNTQTCPLYEQKESTPSPLELSRQTSAISSSIFFDAFEDNNSSIPYYDADHGQLSSDEVDEFVGDSDNENSDTELVSTPTASSASREGNFNDDIVHSKAIGVKKRGMLPAPRPDIGGLSLWSILRKNIGKDLSRISMPVALNEPLSALQRLSEELEYSELIDKACQCEDAYDRMLYIAAFALSPYSTSYYRAGQKVFNPVLGETYELIDEEHNFKFIAEQVSHHPPVSACHAESPNFMFWEDARLKYKFWGQSMELYPTGRINLLLSEKSEHYTWSKVTTCVHNLLNFQSRWIENYGDMLVTCTSTGVTCNICLSKSSYFSNKKYDIKGNVISGEGEKVRHLFGMLKEGIYSGTENGEHVCLWRPNLMPPNSETYYGFSKFAMELNYLPEEMKEYLPLSDSRFRTDQRLLEDGYLPQAEEDKLRIEQIQRDVRAKREEVGEEWLPNFFEKQEHNDLWIYRQNYFSAREAKFADIQIPKLW
ncbi:Oxysterol-binding protein-related protein 6-like isoform X2 [Oopsacas minuta]|uniref:Oxysterol-binding protein n=1 Tax=Oopsacas minuta TaxID=111878 RepID=A0AAV7JEZ5_9METZ|nr:Oxysterol-binding protein-related protein 6-like isoform X2 [Oopsacas minuta]